MEESDLIWAGTGFMEWHIEICLKAYIVFSQGIKKSALKRRTMCKAFVPKRHIAFSKLKEIWCGWNNGEYMVYEAGEESRRWIKQILTDVWLLVLTLYVMGLPKSAVILFVFWKDLSDFWVKDVLGGDKDRKNSQLGEHSRCLGKLAAWLRKRWWKLR